MSPRESFVVRWDDLPRLESESARFELLGPARLTTGCYLMVPVQNEKTARELMRRIADDSTPSRSTGETI